MSTSNRGFRNQRLSKTPEARTRLYNAQAATLEQGLREPNMAYIGGQAVDLNDIAATNAARQDFNERSAYNNAAMQMRAANPLGVRRGKPGGLEGNAVELGQASAPVTQPDGTPQFGAPPLQGLGNAQNPGIGAYQELMNVNPGANPGAPPSPLQAPAPVAVNVNKPAADFFGGDTGGGTSVRRSTMPSTTLGDEFGVPEDPNGFRNGGMIDKQRSVKQPGFKGGGAVCKRSMRGYAMGGQIGDPAQDDGKDTVEVGVREGEYLVAPEGVEVIGDMIGGEAETPYSNGIAFLDQANQAGTGEEPGPVPINEEGEQVSGYANGGGVRMGFNQGGGTFFVNPAGETTTKLGMHPKWQQPVDVRGMSQAAVDKGMRALRSPTIMRGANLANRAGPYVLPAVEGAQVAAVAADDDMTGIDTATQVASGIGRLGSAATGAALGSQFGPVGTLVGGIGGYMVGDELIQGGRKLYNWATDGEMETTDPFDRVGAGQEAPAPEAPPPPAPYGRAFGVGDNVALPTNGLRSAAEAVGPGGMNVVQQTGGPGGEVIVREDVNGVPTFSNLRRGGFDGSTANLQREADVRATEDAARESQRLAQQRERMISSDPALAAQVEAARAKGGVASKIKTDARIARRFQTPKYDAEGNVTGTMEDQGKIKAFDDAMAMLGVDLDGLSRADQNKVFENFDAVYGDTMKAMSAAKSRGAPISDMPRTGANSLRTVPDREILLGDVFGDEATLGDWWAGLGNDDPVKNSYIYDPVSRIKTPARRMVGDGGLRMEDMIRYGLLKQGANTQPPE